MKEVSKKQEMSERDYYIGVLFEEPKFREKYAVDLRVIKLPEGSINCVQKLSKEYDINVNKLSSW